MYQWKSKALEILLKISDRVLGHKAELQELACVLYALAWGFLILICEIGYNIAVSGVVYQGMTLFAPGVVWGCTFLFFGIWGLIGYIFKIKELRRTGAMFGVIGWTIIAYFILVDFNPSFGIIPVSISALFSMLSFIRLGYLDE